MVHRILRSEKYYGMVILQKTYTSSYLSKKIKLNKGELDQYVYKDTHPKVINPNVKKLVERRNDELKGNYQPRRCFLYTLPVIYCAKCKERLSVDGLRKGRRTSNPLFPSRAYRKAKPITKLDAINLLSTSAS